MRRARIRLRGIVQGVGFRPFVHHLAGKWQLAGYVLNSSAGLVAEVEGEGAAVDRFLAGVREEAPPLAWIQEMEIEEIAPQGCTGFEIRHSEVATGEFALISPDVATCPDCLRDCREPGNRRFGYPFTNCTNCGPRYTIIRDIPYDRASTTMAAFPMCAECRREYDDPANRRFHAQPNACPVVRARRSPGRWRGAAAPVRRARFWPSKGSAASTWPAIRATPRRWNGCARASGAATNHSP